MRRENERLRDARASVTRQLGPLPISAAVVAGLVTGFDPEKALNECWLIAAGILFIPLVGLSIWYGSIRPYRALRHEKEQQLPQERRPSTLVEKLLAPSDARVKESDWYAATLELEKKIYGEPRTRFHQRRRPKRTVSSLTEAFERERTGLLIVQTLFAFVIVFLVLARVA